MLSCLLSLAAISPFVTTLDAQAAHATPTASPQPSRTWVESYPALLRYADIPVLVPVLGSMSRLDRVASEGPSAHGDLLGTVVNVSRDGYEVTLATTSLPPWTTQQPLFMGNRTKFYFAGAKAAPSLATSLWLNLPANVDFNHLPGLPVTLANRVRGYLTYFRNITGNGGSSTTLTWRTRSYVYQVSVPIAAGSGGRSAAVALADSMKPLTVQGVRKIIERPFSAIATSDVRKLVTYRDAVTLHLALSSLPQRLDETMPIIESPTAPPYVTGVYHGVGRGYVWRSQMTPVSPLSLPSYTLSHVRISGTAHPGGAVQISGTIMPAPPADVQLAISWPTHGSDGQIHTYPPAEPLPWWGTPNNESFYPLTNVHVHGQHFWVTAPVPPALYDQGIGPSAINRWLVLTPGLYHPQLLVDSGQSNSVALSIHLLSGDIPIVPSFQSGPYLPTGDRLPPVAANNLAYYGMGDATEETSVPLLLPAWAPRTTDPYTIFHQFPLTIMQNIPRGYAAIQFQQGINERAGPAPEPWPQDLSHADLTVFGVHGASSPYAAQITDNPGRSVQIGTLQGTVYALPSGTLVTVLIAGTTYGVFAAHPATAADTVATARSLTEINAPAHASPGNAVLLYASLLRSAQRNHQPRLTDAYSMLWTRTATQPHRTASELRLDDMVSGWAGVQAHVLSVQGSVVTAQFVGVPAEKSTSAHLVARFRVGATGELQLVSTGPLTYTQSALRSLERP